MNAHFVGGNLNGTRIPVEEVKAKYWNGELTPDLSEARARGRLVWRKELDNQPRVDGYVGPMWDGDELRYESHAVYAMLSN